MQHSKGHEVRLFLNGWKEIASYLGLGIRTVQRYEREMGLPIYRPTGKSRGAVIATKAELAGWVNAGSANKAGFPLEPRINSMPRALDSRSNKLGADFLRVDSEVALTFSGMALAATDPEKKRRTARVAREAYDAIVRLRQRIVLNTAQGKDLDAHLQRLKSELQSIGQKF